MPKQLKFFDLKIDKGAGIEKKLKTFLTKGTKNKNIKSMVYKISLVIISRF